MSLSHLLVPPSGVAYKLLSYLRNVAGVNKHVQAMVSVNPFDAVGAAITTASTAVECDVTDASSAVISISGTYAGVNITFEASDDGGVTWFGVFGAQSNAVTSVLTSGVLTNTTRAWKISLAGFNRVQARATAWTSGSATLRISPSPAA